MIWFYGNSSCIVSMMHSCYRTMFELWWNSSVYKSRNKNIKKPELDLQNFSTLGRWNPEIATTQIQNLHYTNSAHLFNSHIITNSSKRNALKAELVALGFTLFPTLPNLCLVIIRTQFLPFHVFEVATYSHLERMKNNYWVWHSVKT